MSDEFYEYLDEILGDADDISDIRAVVRRCWLYDFVDYPTYVWQGQGRLITSDNTVWLGTIDGNGRDFHKVPSIQDGRDGSSATYTTTLNLINTPGMSAQEMYDKLKAEQWRVNGRSVTCYLAIFKINEGLRPQTPVAFFKELTMFSPKFSEKISVDSQGRTIKNYSVSIISKDGNAGRSNVPAGTYADTIQKARAAELGVSLDRGSEFVAALANRTYQVP